MIKITLDDEKGIVDKIKVPFVLRNLPTVINYQGRMFTYNGWSTRDGDIYRECSYYVHPEKIKRKKVTL